MYKLQKLLVLLVRLLVAFYLRKKNLFVVTGLRRSGNHAFINWLANALEETDAGLRHTGPGCLSISESGQTLLFNEANFDGVIDFISTLRLTKKRIKECSFIIISLEDYLPKERDVFIPKEAVKISIKRSTLNVVASRIQRAVSQAKSGLDRGDMAIDNHFVSFLNWQRDNEKHGWLVWSFDDWLRDQGYRQAFLAQLGLSKNVEPQISSQGGGSSFSGQTKIPSSDDLVNRWKEVDIPERVIKLLSEELSSSVLTVDEQAFLNERLALHQEA